MKEKIINVFVVVVMVVIANYPLFISLRKTANEVNAITQGLLAQTNDILNKINTIESDIDGLYKKIDSIKVDAVKNVEDRVESIKEQPIDTIKDLFNIRG